MDDFVSLEDLAEDNVLSIKMTVISISMDLQIESMITYPGVEVVMKNWDPLVSRPALAIERRPTLECFSLKFSSANLLP